MTTTIDFARELLNDGYRDGYDRGRADERVALERAIRREMEAMSRSGELSQISAHEAVMRLRERVLA